MLLLTGRVVEPDESELAAELDLPMPVVAQRRFLQLVQFHKVVPQVAYRLQRLACMSERGHSLAGNLLRELKPKVDRMERMDAQQQRALTELASRKDLGRIIVLKGVQLRSLYVGAPRQSRDLDVLVGPDRLWRSVATLLDAGHHVHKVQLDRTHEEMRQPASAAIQGICEVELFGEEPSPVLLDLHVGVYQPCDEARIRIRDEDVVSRYGVLQPSREAGVVLTVGKVAQFGSCRLRDLNDILLLLRDPDLDAGKLQTELKQAHLHDLWQSVMRLLRTYYGVDQLPLRYQAGKFSTHLDRVMVWDGSTSSDRRVFSRWGQIRYLFSVNRRSRGRLAAAVRTFNNTIRLVWGIPPYRVTRRRRTGRLDSSEHVVLCPVLRFDCDLALDGLYLALEEAGMRVRRLHPYDLVVVNEGTKSELLVAPGTVLVQSNFAGDRTELGDVPAALSTLSRVNLGRRWVV